MPTPKIAVTPWQNVDPAGVQYRIKDVQSLLRISRAKIYDMINRGELPPLIKLGQRASAMPQSWLDAYIRHQANFEDGPTGSLPQPPREH